MSCLPGALGLLWSVDAAAEPPRFEVSAGAGVFGRKLAYRDIVTRGLPAYELPATPTADVAAAVYALNGPTWALGVSGRYLRAFGFQSQTPQGDRIDSTHDRWQAGLRLAHRGQPASPLWGAELLVSGTRFSFDGEGASALPAASYTSLLLSLDGQLPLGPVVLGARGAAGWVAGLGPLLDRFPRARAGVLQGAGWVGVPVASMAQLRLGAEVLHHFMKFYPEPGDAFVAGGAVDQYARIFLEAAFRL